MIRKEGRKETIRINQLMQTMIDLLPRRLYLFWGHNRRQLFRDKSTGIETRKFFTNFWMLLYIKKTIKNPGITIRFIVRADSFRLFFYLPIFEYHCKPLLSILRKMDPSAVSV